MAITSGASGDIFTQRLHERVDWTVADAMVKVAEEYGVKGKVYITSASEQGRYSGAGGEKGWTVVCGLLLYSGIRLRCVCVYGWMDRRNVGMHLYICRKIMIEI